ncbi:hypothetical protein BGZ70_004026 [Mortierella alpina]|uniref:Uncharacterized protein n=1 Tax=Mortierella alpina TaxID=64518 RepID=A0A9P6JAB2_MORAP|nr:hypothetical protein BGZ70_004026 [Mortierella alpina]
MKFSLTSTLLLAACTLATLLSTAEADQKACDNRCQIKLSVAVEKCIKQFPVTDSDDRLQCNEAPVAAERKCEDRCRDIAVKCSEKCFLKANAAWEPCVVTYENPTDPKRIQCLRDVEDARLKHLLITMKSSTASLIAIVGMLAIGLTSVNAQGDPVCIKKADEAFSTTIGPCILAHRKKPRHPERKECVSKAYDKWMDSLENCYE